MNTAEKLFLLAFIVRASLFAQAPDSDIIRQGIILLVWGALFVIAGNKRGKERNNGN